MKYKDIRDIRLQQKDSGLPKCSLTTNKIENFIGFVLIKVSKGITIAIVLRTLGRSERNCL